MLISLQGFDEQRFRYRVGFGVLLSIEDEIILTGATFNFDPRNLNESAGPRRASKTNWW